VIDLERVDVLLRVFAADLDAFAAAADKCKPKQNTERWREI
jgi:hypothetical protein